MATKRASSKTPPARRPVVAKKPAHSGFVRPGLRLIGRFLRWVGSSSRPQSVSQGLTLVFVLLALATLIPLAVRAAVDHAPLGSGPFWAACLLVAAVIARSSPWWRTELGAMTRDRARTYTGAALLVMVALSLSWHIITINLGWGSTFLLLGPLSAAPGAFIVLGCTLAVSIALLLNINVVGLARRGARNTGSALDAARERHIVESHPIPVLPADTQNDELPRLFERTEVTEPVSVSTSPAAPPAITGRPASALPPIDIFSPPPKPSSAPLDLEIKAKRIQDTLASFNVGARVVGHHSGPVVTQFDIEPDKGVKVRRITELQNDLALALAAPTIRIQAPVPGRAVVGIEIPNLAATMVALRELLESDEYCKSPSPLTVAIGKDVAGNSDIIDLARMPHLLVAGATGSGKSVFVNTLISCLLYRNTPEQVRLLLVDPKKVELSVFNGVPHLLSPVVTDMEKVVGVLQWAMREMERRYQLFADNTVRNIQRYNEKMDAAGLKKLPYLVLIVDELADLMMTSPEDVEDAICRLAQLARAAGIHLVLATQRPSVDVVTGLIKANFPARIAFNMTSQVDSRTILDTAGAEKLLGRGDMLYQPPDAPKPVRLQGAFLSDSEIERLVEFWKMSPLLDVVSQVSEQEFEAAEREAADVEDELLNEAIRVVREYQHASVSLLQRRLRVGYSRAARLMDQLEARRIVAPADGSKQRAVLDAD